MNEDCRVQHRDQFHAIVPKPNSAWDWKYDDGRGNHPGMDTSAYCAWKYGNNASSDPQAGGAFNWGCYYLNYYALHRFKIDRTHVLQTSRLLEYLEPDCNQHQSSD
ncbi:hypothetical protein GQ44DRAFT_725016 [Phaeosphaeriaceae sp. PMI808]|nr:hypothetical protein GQ44DRAFT_725016 [Phaeosphaeriaceae sp. PMI808]